jgi:hypothetical protein
MLGISINLNEVLSEDLCLLRNPLGWLFLFRYCFVRFPDILRNLLTDANRIQDPSRLASPTSHGILVGQSGHNRLNRLSIEFYDLARPAGVEPATYGIEGLKNL